MKYEVNLEVFGSCKLQATYIVEADCQAEAEELAYSKMSKELDTLDNVYVEFEEQDNDNQVILIDDEMEITP